MKITKNNIRKATVKVAIEKINMNHGRTLAKLGDGIDSELRTEVDSFIEKNRSALRRLAKK